jgi:hypothetical protein
MNRQAKTALDQADKSYGLMRQVSALEDKVSGLVTQVMHLKECDSFLVEFIESACEQLKCKFSADPFEFLAASISFVFSWICIFQVLAYILLMKTIRFPSESRIWKGYQRIRILYGLTRGAAALLFFYRIVLNTLGKLSMVVKDH